MHTRLDTTAVQLFNAAKQQPSKYFFVNAQNVKCKVKSTKQIVERADLQPEITEYY